MNKKKRYLRTFLALLLIAVCMAAGLLMPGKVSDWYDTQTLGKVDYTGITCEPYQITYYDSFEEKLDAIAQGMAHGYIYTLEIGERNDLIKDEDLLETANEELGELYKAGILPEPFLADTVSQRIFCELCSVRDYSTDAAEDSEAVRNIYIWFLECRGKNGEMVIQMDSEYHKIYSIVMNLPAEKADVYAWENIWNEVQKTQMDWLSAGWRKYWHLMDTVLEQTEYTDGDTYEKSEWMMRHFDFIMESGYRITIPCILSFYGEWSLQTGLVFS